MRFKKTYGIVDSLYPPIQFPIFELVETLEDSDTGTWYKVRIYTKSLDKWIISQDKDKWDHAASDNYRGDSIMYWIHGSLYTFMILKWNKWGN